MSTKKKNKPEVKEYVNCLWGIVCSMSAIDQEKNNISLFNVISQLSVPEEVFEKSKEVPVLVQHVHELVVVFRRAVESKYCDNELIIDVKISLIDPTGKALSEIISPIKFDIGKRTMRFRIQLPGFPLTTSGDYVYRIEVRQPTSKDLVKVDEVPFEVLPKSVVMQQLSKR